MKDYNPDAFKKLDEMANILFKEIEEAPEEIRKWILLNTEISSFIGQVQGTCLFMRQDIPKFIKAICSDDGHEITIPNPDFEEKK